jgi:ADP-heptose:LPS heptosyltransferase
MPLVAPSAADAARAATVWHELLAPFAPPCGVVALHPGSGGAAKCWPPPRFAALAARLWQAGLLPLLIAGPADEAVLARLLAEIAPLAAHPAPSSPSSAPLARPVRPLPSVLPVARDLPLPVLAGVLARCHAFVGNDAGVSHLAALVGCPTLALFGPTDPAVWAPVGRHVRVVRAHASAGGVRSMAALPLSRVWRSLERLLAASA